MDEHLQSLILSLQESIRLWAPGKENQKKREIYVAEHFLRGLSVEFSALDLTQPEADPPDVLFKEASFEIKEIQNSGRRRHDEYRRRLEEAQKATSLADLIESYHPEDIPIARIFERLMEETRRLASNKYPFKVRRSIDLLFYVNFDMRRAWNIEDGRGQRLSL